LIDGVLALDAGALTASLDLEALARVDHIILTHSHFDHVKDLPLLSDLVVGLRPAPVTVWASHACVQTLRENLFNGALWPDFTRIPSPERPTFQLRSFTPGDSFQVGPYAVTSIPVAHPVESCGFVIRRNGVALGISGDTGPTDRLWQGVNGTPEVQALLLGNSLPHEVPDLGGLSGALPPRTLCREPAKVQANPGER